MEARTNFVNQGLTAPDQKIIIGAGNNVIKPLSTIRKLAGVTCSVIFYLLYSFIWLAGVSIFYESLMSNDGGHKPLLIIILGYLMAVFLLASMQFFALKILLRSSQRLLLLSVTISLTLGYTISPWPLLSSMLSNRGANQMNAPFNDAKKFHPRVTFINYSIQKNPEGETISANVTVSVTADHRGEMEITGGLYDKIEKANVNYSPIIYESETSVVQVGKMPTQITFRILLSPDVKRDVNIFGVSMNFNANARDYDPNAILLHNPVDDVDDSGQSKAIVLPDFDSRTVFYQIDLQHNPTIENNPLLPSPNPSPYQQKLRGVYRGRKLENNIPVLLLNPETGGTTEVLFAQAQTLNKQGVNVFLAEYFREGDTIEVESTGIIGGKIQASRIQNLTR